MATNDPPLRFLAQPESNFRERYVCERGPNRNQRFQHAERNSGYTYPTLSLSNSWKSIATHICVTLVTVRRDETTPIFIHPYPISNDDPNVLKNEETNSLFFPITEEEFRVERKEFHIAQHRLTLDLLRNYGPLRCFETNLPDPSFPVPTDSKHFMQNYQLSRSKLYFCFARFTDGNPVPTVYRATGVFSQERFGKTVVPKFNSEHCDFAPIRGDKRGGDKILMTIDNVDRRRAPILQFDPTVVDTDQTIVFTFINKNTLKFITPPCPIAFPLNSRKVVVPIVMMQSSNPIARIHFTYDDFSQCPNCGANLHTTNTNDELEANGDSEDNFSILDESPSHNEILERDACRTPNLNCALVNTPTASTNSSTDVTQQMSSCGFIDDDLDNGFY